MSIDWDVDSYKTEFETDEHWELKKRFMLAHKDKFPEDELVCLAQVFTNIEFMGCRYPEETMKRVAYLAKGLVEDFREKKKNCLKRTFVTASDAASSKVKGLATTKEEGLSTPEEVKPKPNLLTKKLKKRSKPQSNNSDDKQISKKELKRRNKQLRLDTLKAVTWSRIFNGRLCDQSNSILDNFIVLYFEEKDNPLSILSKSASANKLKMRWSYENKDSLDKKVSKLYFDEELIAEAEGESLKQCRKKAAQVALDKLKENCFGIKLNTEYRGLGVSNTDFDGSDANFLNVLGENNIGARLMLLMGWKGGGLGRKEQGIKEPITPNLLTHREGLGSSLSSCLGYNVTYKPVCHLAMFKTRAENFIRNWLKSDSKDDLMFSPEFTAEERKVLHLTAQTFGMKSKSQGGKNNRRLIISRKQHPLEILEDLIKAGGSTNKFQLIYPGKMSGSSPKDC